MRLSLIVAVFLAVPLLAAQQAPPTPSYPRSVTLTLSDAKGQPASDASVQVWANQEKAGVTRHFSFEDFLGLPSQPPEATVQANAAGLITLSLSADTEVFEASAPGIGTSGLCFVKELDGDALKLVLQPQHELTGTVRLADGQAAPNAVVRFSSSLSGKLADWMREGHGLPRPPADLATDVAGCFRVSLDENLSGDAWALIDGARTESVHVCSASWSTSSIELRLSGQFHIRGFCRDPEGAPVADAKISALRRTTDACSATTRADGSFDIALVHAGRYVLDAKLPRTLALPETAKAEVREEAPIADVILQPVKATSIRGTVSGGRGRDVTLSADLADQRLSSSPLRVTETHLALLHEDGDFELRGLTPGQSYDIVALRNDPAPDGTRHPHSAGLRIPAIPAGAQDVAIVFDETAVTGRAVEIRCVDALSGAALAGAKVQDAVWTGGVSFEPAPAFARRDVPPVFADAQGTATMTGLSPTVRHGFIVSASGHEPVALGPCNLGPTRLELSAALRPLASSAVHVQDAAGAPLAAVDVVAFLPDAPMHEKGSFVRASSDAQGDAQLEGVNGLSLWVWGAKDAESSALVRCTPGSAEAPLVLSLRPHAALPRASLDIQVVDGSGAAVPGITLKLVPTLQMPEAATAASLTCTTDDAGHAHLDGLLPAVWRVIGDDPDRGMGLGFVAVPGGTATNFVLRVE